MTKTDNRLMISLDFDYAPHYFRVESQLTLGAEIWAVVPEDLKQLTPLNSFKQGIKKWNPSNYLSRLCKTYVQNLDFIIGPVTGIKIGIKKYL